MEISEEKLVRDEHRVETAMDLAETRIFLKYPAEREHKAEYRRFIAEHASEIMRFVVGDPTKLDEKDMFSSLHHYRYDPVTAEVSYAIERMQYWIKEYEKFYAGNRRAINEDELIWPEGDMPEDYPKRPFSALDDYVRRFTVTASSSVQEWQEKPLGYFKERIAKDVEFKYRPAPWKPMLDRPLNPDVAGQLAVVWIPEMLSSRRLALEDLYNDVVVDIAVLKRLQIGEYTTERQAREAAFTEQASKSGAFPTGNNMPWTLREVVTSFAFIVEWARERAKTGGDLDAPANLGRLPEEIVRMISGIATNMMRNQPTSDTLVPRLETTYLKNLDKGMEHIVDHIYAIVRPHNAIIYGFAKSRELPVDVSRKRLDHAVSVAKMLLQVVEAQPDGDSARAIVEKHGVRIRTIRRLLVDDMEWLLDERHQTLFLDREFDRFSRFPDEDPITRESAAEALDSSAKKWLRDLGGTLDMVLAFWNETTLLVDQKQSDGEERMSKKPCLPSTARATRRSTALKARIASLAGTAKSPDTKLRDSFASVFV